MLIHSNVSQGSVTETFSLCLWIVGHELGGPSFFLVFCDFRFVWSPIGYREVLCFFKIRGAIQSSLPCPPMRQTGVQANIFRAYRKYSCRGSHQRASSVSSWYTPTTISTFLSIRVGRIWLPWSVFDCTGEYRCRQRRCYRQLRTTTAGNWGQRNTRSGTVLMICLFWLVRNHPRWSHIRLGP